MAEEPQRLDAVRRLIGGPSPGATSHALAPWLQRMCAAAAQALPATGVSVALITNAGALGVAAASDAGAQDLGELQFTLGEGPCLDAFAGRRPVLQPDLRRSETVRWPGYTPAALARGVRAVFSLPLQIGAAQLGAMDIFRNTPGPLSQTSLRHALDFADVTVEALLDAQAGTRSDGESSGLDGALDSHCVVYQAQGMTMVDLGTSLTDALARLRAHAFANDRSLHDVALDVVEGRLRLEPDTP